MTYRQARRIAAVVSAVMLITGCAAFAQVTPRPAHRTPVLWTDPGRIAARDLFWGNGSAERAPTPPFTFVEEDTDGTQPKIVVRDATGREWSAKFGEEVHSGIAASRIVWALGYAADEIYFVDKGTIGGITTLTQAADAIGPGGSFAKDLLQRVTGHSAVNTVLLFLPKIIEGRLIVIDDIERKHKALDIDEFLVFQSGLRLFGIGRKIPQNAKRKGHFFLLDRVADLNVVSKLDTRRTDTLKTLLNTFTFGHNGNPL